MFAHYKFKSSLQYDTAIFDGFRISVKDLKNVIMQQKKIGESSNVDLQVTNAQTKEVYDDESTLIPRNASFLITRIPVSAKKRGQWTSNRHKTLPARVVSGGPLAKAIDLSSSDASENDKINAMMSQSTYNYDPSNYTDIRGSNQVGPVPANYKCFNCYQGGHWIRNCTFGRGRDRVKIRKCTGIPTSSMVVVEGPEVPGALMTPNGQFAVPLMHYQAYTQKGNPTSVPVPKPDTPEELLCKICSDRMTDAAMIPCCGCSFCDDCIRFVLLESEDHECPVCHTKHVSPDTLIPNLVLRNSVAISMNAREDIKKHVTEEPVPIEFMNSNPMKVLAPIAMKTEQRIIAEADTTQPDFESIRTNGIHDSAKLKESDSIVDMPETCLRSPKHHCCSRDGSPGDCNKSAEETVHRSCRIGRSRNGSTSIKTSENHLSPSYGDSPARKSVNVTENWSAGKYNPPTTCNSTLISNGVLKNSVATFMSAVGDFKKRVTEEPVDAANPAKRSRQRSSQRRSRDVSRYQRSPSLRNSGSPRRKSSTPTLDEPIVDVLSPMYNANYIHHHQGYDLRRKSGPLNVTTWHMSDSSGPPSFKSSGSSRSNSPPPTFDYPIKDVHRPTNIANYQYPPQGVDPSMVPGPWPVFESGYPLINYYLDCPYGYKSDRAPEGVIDDPLAVFESYLQVKDEQKRRVAQITSRKANCRSRRRSPDRRVRSSRSGRSSGGSNASTSGSHRSRSPPRHSPPPSRRGPYRYRSPLRSRYDDERSCNRNRRRGDSDNRDR